jgi:hypothetical protein
MDLGPIALHAMLFSFWEEQAIDTTRVQDLAYIRNPYRHALTVLIRDDLKPL